MVLIHGLGEHSQRYDGNFSNFWIDKGFVISTFDIPGFGKSSGIRGHIHSPDEVLTIVDDLVDSFKKVYPGKPIFIYGHSMGGEIALWHSLLNKPDVSCIVSSSPSIGTKDTVSPLKLFLAKFMDKVLPSFTMDNGINSGLLSKDTEIIRKYKEDPLVHRKVSARTGMMILEKGQWILENAKNNSIRTLVLLASEEGLVNPDAIRTFCKKAPDAELKFWPGLFHELHNEPEYMDVLNFIRGWVMSNA